MSAIDRQFAFAEKAAKIAYVKAWCQRHGMSDADAEKFASEYAGDVYLASLDYWKRTHRVECRNTLNAAKA